MKVAEKKELFNQLNDTPFSFTLKIEDLVHETNIGYMEAILKYCRDNDIDESLIPALITDTIKTKLETEAIKLNLIKKEYQTNAIDI